MSLALLARALFAVARGALALFDELLDLLSTLLSDALVEVWPITVSRGFATLFATLFADLLVELVSVGLFRVKVSYSSTEGWCFIGDSATPKRATSQSSTYAKHRNRNNSNSV
jgi:hypothetical protein